MTIVICPDNFDGKCAICGKSLDLKEATAGANSANGQPILAHEFHRKNLTFWILFWAEFEKKNCQINYTKKIYQNFGGKMDEH